MRKIPALSLIVLPVLALTACGQLREGYDKGFKESYVKSFNSGCIKDGVQSGQPEAQVKSICECVSQYLVHHYSTGTLTKLSANLEAPESKRMFDEALSACPPKSQ